MVPGIVLMVLAKILPASWEQFLRARQPFTVMSRFTNVTRTLAYGELIAFIVVFFGKIHCSVAAIHVCSRSFSRRCFMLGVIICENIRHRVKITVKENFTAKQSNRHVYFMTL